MFPLTLSKLSEAASLSSDSARRWLDHINQTAAIYRLLDNPFRMAAWIAQVGHESAGFHYTREIWGPTKAQLGYEGRRDLGNDQTGDGKRYLGRGLIQVTGRANYKEMGIRLYQPFETFPELLEQDQWAARVAGEFWMSRRLNAIADMGTEDSFRDLTRRINGGFNGYADRFARWEIAKRVFLGN